MWTLGISNRDELTLLLYLLVKSFFKNVCNNTIVKFDASTNKGNETHDQN